MMIKAAGGVLYREVGDLVKVLLVHRERYDDWSFPKGKRDPGEDDLQCAVREVKEETGLSGEIGVELSAVHYIDRKGRDKTVRYWVMKIVEGEFVPNDEVDSVAWLVPSVAAERLTYPHDVDLLSELVKRLGP